MDCSLVAVCAGSKSRTRHKPAFRRCRSSTRKITLGRRTRFRDGLSGAAAPIRAKRKSGWLRLSSPTRAPVPMQSFAADKRRGAPACRPEHAPLCRRLNDRIPTNAGAASGPVSTHMRKLVLQMSVSFDGYVGTERRVDWLFLGFDGELGAYVGRGALACAVAGGRSARRQVTGYASTRSPSAPSCRCFLACRARSGSRSSGATVLLGRRAGSRASSS
jgi:hypothetical protein